MKITKTELAEIIREGVKKAMSEQYRDRAPRARKPVDDAAVRELVLYITNDHELYRRQVIPIIDNLRKKIKRNVYDADKAVKLWKYLADAGAKKYTQEFGTQDAMIFSPATREAAAVELRDNYDEELMYPG